MWDARCRRQPGNPPTRGGSDAGVAGVDVRRWAGGKEGGGGGRVPGNALHPPSAHRQGVCLGEPPYAVRRRQPFCSHHPPPPPARCFCLVSPPCVGRAQPCPCRQPRGWSRRADGGDGGGGGRRPGSRPARLRHHGGGSGPARATARGRVTAGHWQRRRPPTGERKQPVRPAAGEGGAAAGEEAG